MADRNHFLAAHPASGAGAHIELYAKPAQIEPALYTHLMLKHNEELQP